MSDAVKTKQEGAIFEIIMNRPDALNAMNMELIDGLGAAVIMAGDSDARAVIIRGEGRGFCAGGDIRHFAMLVEKGETVPPEMPDRLHEMVENLTELPIPVIAAIHGPCAGAGMSLMLACDLAVASEESKFNLAYVGIGLSPDGSSSYFLPRHVGSKKAMEIFLTGKNMTAKEVFELGLVNQIVPADAVLNTARQFAAQLAKGPTLSYGKVKRLVHASSHNTLNEQLALETELICESSETEDFRNGIAAFLEKKRPEFHGR
jgi:2-(1,2-epoxy-1,2-dihydrophenyl)acetyl-CoA isomerase